MLDAYWKKADPTLTDVALRNRVMLSTLTGQLIVRANADTPDHSHRFGPTRRSIDAIFRWLETKASTGPYSIELYAEGRLLAWCKILVQRPYVGEERELLPVDPATF